MTMSIGIAIITSCSTVVLLLLFLATLYELNHVRKISNNDYKRGATDTQNFAANAGHGKYELDEKTGEVEFKWNHETASKYKR